MTIDVFSAEEVERLTPMDRLIPALHAAFCRGVQAPPRSAHETSPTSSLLLMPAWDRDGGLGVKVSTVRRNASPSVSGTYLLLNQIGHPIALFDGAMLTARRTAAASALAADKLARRDADTLLIVGTGTLVRHMMEAYTSVRRLRRILLWGRNPSKARTAAAAGVSRGFAVEHAETLEDALEQADIVCTVTMATSPLIRGALLRPGMHLDLVGAFRHDMTEADPECFRRASIFVDTREGALDEAGDLRAAIAAGGTQANDVGADLTALCVGVHPGRTDAAEITLFKSVGVAIEDLAAARLVHDTRRRRYDRA